VTEARGSTRLDTVDTSFQTFANDQLKDIADGIVASFNSGFTESTGAWKTKNDIKNGVVNVINAMFKPYTDSGADIVSANTAWKLEAVAGVALNESALLDLAEGESLDIYIESEADPSLDEFASSEAELEIENLRIAFSAAGLKMTQFVELENFLRDCALEAQSIFDSIHMEASRRDDIAIFRNPSSLGILHQIGVGAAALVGTHATTALAQRFLNKDGKTEGTKYYAAEYVPAVLAAGAGAYMYHKQERPDIGLPLIGGAIGSVLLRVLTRRYVNKDNFISKYFLRYLGAAPAELIGDKTLGYINLEKQTSDLATKAAQLFIASSMLENDPKAIELRDSIPKNLSVLGLTITGETLSSGETKATHDEKIEAFKALQKTCAALEPMIAAYASKMLARGGG
jgi:hypothetical protein